MMQILVAVVGQDTVALMGRAARLMAFYALTLPMASLVPVLIPAVVLVGVLMVGRN